MPPGGSVARYHCRNKDRGRLSAVSVDTRSGAGLYIGFDLHVMGLLSLSFTYRVIHYLAVRIDDAAATRLYLGPDFHLCLSFQPFGSMPQP
jgi:hypothetical protein